MKPARQGKVLQLPSREEEKLLLTVKAESFRECKCPPGLFAGNQELVVECETVAFSSPSAFCAAFREHSVAIIAVALSSRGCSVAYIAPCFVSSQGRRGPPPRKIKTASAPRSMYVAHYRAKHLSRPAQSGWWVPSKSNWVMRPRSGRPRRGISLWSQTTSELGSFSPN
jgi:hypothetical protein